MVEIFLISLIVLFESPVIEKVQYYAIANCIASRR